MRRKFALPAIALVLAGTAGYAAGYNNGHGDADIPTSSGGCSDALGCHSRSSTATIALSAQADDGIWNTPGESGTITATVNIDAVADDDSIPGVALLDFGMDSNIKTAGWTINTDANSNPSPFNYNERNHVLGDEVFVWHVNAPSSQGSYVILGRLFHGREEYNQDTLHIVLANAVSEKTGRHSGESLLALHASPNPFGDLLTVSYGPVGSGPASLDVYDASGKAVRSISGGESLDGGIRSSTWDGRDDRGQLVPEGVYFLRLSCGGQVAAAKAVLVR